MIKVLNKFFLMIVLLVFFSSKKVSGASDYDEPARPHYDLQGNITWTAVDKKAASKVTSWSTTGFTLRADTCKLSENGVPEGNDGNPRKNSKYAILNLKENWKKSKKMNGGIIYTTFEIPKVEVNKAVRKAKVNSLKLQLSGGNIYLNGIFRINFRNGRSEHILKTKENIYKLKDIMYPSGVSWTRPQDFRDRFDVRVPYEPAPVPIYLTVMKYDGKKYSTVSHKKVATTKPHTKFITKTDMIPAKIGKETDYNYYLYRTYWADMGEQEKVHKNGTYRRPYENLKIKYNPKIDFENYKIGLRALRNRSYEVFDQGIEIVCVYKKYKKEKSKNHQEEVEEDIIEPFVDGIIQADECENEKFDSEHGIPSSEMQYVNITTSEYLTQYKFRRYYGTKTYLKKIPSKKEKDKKGKPPPPIYKTVSRTYSYWKIIDLNVYKLTKAKVNNYSLPNEQVSLYPNQDYIPPNVSYVKHNEHLKEPMDRQTSIGHIKVRNDYLTFNGIVVMSDNWSVTSTSLPTKLPREKRIEKSVCFLEHLQIAPQKANGTYESEGTVTYTRVCHVGSEAEGNTIEYDIDTINNVVVHTPVICEGVVQDVKTYNQLLYPDRSVSGLVLDQNFKILLPSNGYHSNLKRYGERDYCKYISKKEVQFSFDIYQNGCFYSANTWIPIKEEENMYYLPIWVKEGYHNIKFRTRAINCDFNHRLENEESFANADIENYVATCEKTVEISGRLYGLTLYDISDYPIWKTVFRKPNSLCLNGIEYKVGCNNQNGYYTGRDTKNTFVMLKGSHPYYPNIGVQKTGYVSRFYLNSVGTLASSYDKIHIKPTYFYIGKNGERLEVDVYYTETIDGKSRSLVKIGSKLDETNKKSIQLGERYLSVPNEEIKEKARLFGRKLEELNAEQADVYTFNDIMIPQQLRTYIGANYTPNGKIPISVDEKKVSKAMQKWYFEFYLPSEIHICKKGYNIFECTEKQACIDYKEPFWLKDGYLLVNFQIETISDGVRKLSYTNEGNFTHGYCNMWEMEGFQYQKRDFFGQTFHFKNGDTILYQINKSAARDYINSGTH